QGAGRGLAGIRTRLAPRLDVDRRAALVEGLLEGSRWMVAVVVDRVQRVVPMGVVVGQEGAVCQVIDLRTRCQAGRTIPDLQDLGAGSQATPGPPRADRPSRGIAMSGPGAQYYQGESCHDRILFAM